jgi:hypothetical protein
LVKRFFKELRNEGCRKREDKGLLMDVSFALAFSERFACDMPYETSHPRDIPQWRPEG